MASHEEKLKEKPPAIVEPENEKDKEFASDILQFQTRLMSLQILIEREVVKRGHLEDIVLETLTKSNLYKVLDYSKKPEGEMPGRNYQSQQGSMPELGRASGILSPGPSKKFMYYETLKAGDPITINRSR